MVEEILAEAVAVATEAVVMVEEILAEAAAVATEAVTEQYTKAEILVETQVVETIEADTVVETMVV
jgi:hypothetical protein